MNKNAVLAKETVKKILLVRASFRMGNSVLATPFISFFRENFPNARIDFVGSPMSNALFRNLPIDHAYQVTRRFPHASWAYFTLLRQIRAVGYDLAVELSGSQSAMGAWIVGLSGSRYRIGMEGKRDHWFDVRLPKPKIRNKYELCSAVAASLGLTGTPILPQIVLSDSEKNEGLRTTASLYRDGKTPHVGVFLGGRARKGKRWPTENFYELIKHLHGRGARVLIFIGPEEEDLSDYFSWALNEQVPIIYEKSVRPFAALVSACKLFVACDSGPMHLACALGVRTVAVFRKENIYHWGPPSGSARIVQGGDDRSFGRVLRACLLELWRLERPRLYDNRAASLK